MPATIEVEFRRRLFSTQPGQTHSHIIEIHAGNEASTFLGNLIDYWMESEIMHSGSSAIEAYHVNSGPTWRENFDHLQDLIAHLLDLCELAALTTRALLRGFGADKQLERPAALSIAPASAANAAMEFLQSHNISQII